MSKNILLKCVSMNEFIAIDVETANYHATSICALGAVKVSDGQVVDRFYELIKPEPNWYVRHFSENIHGIFPEDTNGAETFDRVWLRMARRFGYASGEITLPLVAHNKSFDERCLKASFNCYGMTWLDNDFYCTLSKARREIPKAMVGGSYSLPCVCRFLGIPFNNHHNALADAEACAEIAITLL